MTKSQIKLFKQICSKLSPTKDCIIACYWLHPEIDGGFPIVFVQSSGGVVINCMTVAAQFDLDQRNCPLPDGVWHCPILDNKFYIDGKEAKDDIA